MMAVGQTATSGRIDPSAVEQVEAPVTRKGYLICAFAAFGGVLLGYDSGYISSVLAMDEFKRVYGHKVPRTVDQSGWLYSTSEKSLIVSILSAGTFFGALASSAFADYIGRRLSLILACGIFMVGVLLQVAETTVLCLVNGRLIAGVGVGFISAVTILYLSEIAPRKIRGAVVSCYQFAITVGIMLGSCVTYATQHRRDTSAFRIPIAVQFVWAIILGSGLLFLPESPRYLIKTGRLDLALNALSRLRGQNRASERIQDELSEMLAHYNYESQDGEKGWADCFRGGVQNRKSNAHKVFVGTALQMFQQFSGINFIFYYNTTFFAQSGVRNPFLISAVTTIVNVLSTPVSFYTIERFGRRPLLIWGAVVMGVCQLLVASVCTAEPDTHNLSRTADYTLITFVCIYIFSFASTWGPVGWVVVGEIYPLPIRAKAVAISTAGNWLWNCALASIAPYLVDPQQGDLGGKVFYIWGSACLIGCAPFAYYFVPETKGLTLEQVDNMWETTDPRQSRHWRMHTNFEFTSDHTCSLEPSSTPSGSCSDLSQIGKARWDSRKPLNV